MCWTRINKVSRTIWFLICGVGGGWFWCRLTFWNPLASLWVFSCGRHGPPCASSSATTWDGFADSMTPDYHTASRHHQGNLPANMHEQLRSTTKCKGLFSFYRILLLVAFLLGSDNWPLLAFPLRFVQWLFSNSHCSFWSGFQCDSRFSLSLLRSYHFSFSVNAPLIPSFGSPISQPPPYYGGVHTNSGKYKTYVDPTTYEDPYQALIEFTYDISPNDVFITQVIGGGEFGDVCLGGLSRNSPAAAKWCTANTMGRMFENEQYETVAIKTLKSGSSAKAKAEFLTEATIMGQFSHPNVIRLIGVVTSAEPVMIVAEYMSNGSLDQYLRNADQRGEKVHWDKINEMLYGIASGMKYLTDMGYVHRVSWRGDSIWNSFLFSGSCRPERLNRQRASLQDRRLRTVPRSSKRRICGTGVHYERRKDSSQMDSSRSHHPQKVHTFLRCLVIRSCHLGSVLFWWTAVLGLDESEGDQRSDDRLPATATDGLSNGTVPYCAVVLEDGETRKTNVHPAARHVPQVHAAAVTHRTRSGRAAETNTEPGSLEHLRSDRSANASIDRCSDAESRWLPPSDWSEPCVRPTRVQQHPHRSRSRKHFPLGSARIRAHSPGVLCNSRRSERKDLLGANFWNPPRHDTWNPDTASWRRFLRLIVSTVSFIYV